MIYSNDETDKILRQKNYILTVFILPISVAIVIAGLFYLASHILNRFDSVFGYYIAFIIGFFLHGFNKRNWLKMPDGTFNNIKGVTPPHKVSLNEPNDYDEEYFVPNKDKIIQVVIGTFMICAAIFLGIKNVRGIILPIFMGGMGIFSLYIGIKALLDKTPRLKLAKQGLWTAKLGFVDWNDITKAQVVVDKGGRSVQTVLEIFLKGTVFAEADKPDERLNVTALPNKEYIETIIDNLISKRNELEN